MALTVRERGVLFGLVRWPGLSDLELSEKLGLGRSTVTVVRQRLERGGLVSRFFVPDFLGVGCGLLSALYGEFSGVVSAGDVLRESVRAGVSDVFYMVRCGGLHLSLGAAASLADVVEGIRVHHRLHHESGFLTDKRHNYVFFPLKCTSVHRFFDYGPLLADFFGRDYGKQEEKVRRDVEWEPGRREAKTLVSLVKHPNATDEEVAKHAGVSRQTVNVLRNKFLREGLLKVVNVPDVSKLGFGLMAFTHLHMNPHHTPESRGRQADLILSDPAHVLKVSGDLESVMLSVHKDFSDYRRSQDRLADVCRSSKLTLGEPVTQLFPLDQTEAVVHHEYGKVLSNVFSG